MENQISQLSKQIADQGSGSFSENTVDNPRESCKAITLRSGKVVTPEAKKPMEIDEEEVGESEMSEKYEKGEEKKMKEKKLKKKMRMRLKEKRKNKER